ncbi:helix-turn-helix domain-containing protein [Pelistega suis]|uniref:helix-turn-helix domain-containing protein n=1 Tax=Pelistega suis TaxID=1631957 RepID=UPI00211BFDB6|nr:helix-turn-helix domain-containing protein [Pelistega suis]MCQ9329149.1 helix-turn-helix domain-containing protein [Pelistega suis]
MIKRLLLNEESIHCANCMLGHICMPHGMGSEDIERLAELVKERIRIPKGEFLYRIGHEANAIYSIRTGTIKTHIENHNGHSQITGFFLPGEVFGLDSMATGQHLSHAVALEDTEVCVMHTDDLATLSQQLPPLQHQINRLLTGEISRSHQQLLSLGALRSEQRLASFLLDMSERFTRLGYSSQEFRLRMSREEIGNYLGLTLETTSRLFSRFQKEGLIQIQQRTIKILDRSALFNLLKTEDA